MIEHKIAAEVWRKLPDRISDVKHDEVRSVEQSRANISGVQKGSGENPRNDRQLYAFINL